MDHFIHLVHFITGAEEKTLAISENGIDFSDCGISTPCRTIGFVPSHRAFDNDIINIENSQISRPFIIDKSFYIPRNITLQGFNGRPTISTKSTFQPVYLFEENESKKLKFITLRIINLTFKAVGVLRLVNMTNNNILFQNCHFENVFTTHDIIRIESHPSEIPHGLVSFHFCQFRSNVASRTISILKSNSIFNKDNFKSNKRRFPRAAEIGKSQLLLKRWEEQFMHLVILWLKLWIVLL